MGKCIYLTDVEIKWLLRVLCPLSENDPYWKNENGFRDMMDGICNKLDDRSIISKIEQVDRQTLKGDPNGT